MSFKETRKSLSQDLDQIKENGLWKTERFIDSDQKNQITLADGSEVINMCANNYLGLANNPRVIDAAKRVLINGVLVWPRSVSFAALKPSTKN